MSAFTLYGGRGSTNTARVRMTLAEGNITEYEHVQLDLGKREQKSPENLARHPFGKVPVLTVPNGPTIYESRAICKYITRKYSLPLMPAPTNFDELALFDQAEAVETIYFSDPAGKVSFEKFAKKMLGIPTDDAVVKSAVQSLETFFDVAERLLKDKQYMAGDNFSLVDIFYLPIVGRLFACGHGDLVTKRETVNAWWKRCTERPAIAKLMAADRETAAAFKP